MLISILGIWYFGGKHIGAFFKTKTIYTEPNMSCKLNESECKLILKDGTSLNVSITPKEINPLQQVTFSVKNSGAKNIQVVIYGLNMNMGYHKNKLTKTTDGTFSLSTVLPSCSIDMKWQADFEVEKQDALYGGGFIFWSKK